MKVRNTERPRSLRLATILAAVGALVMSSGIALIATSPAEAAPGQKWFVCKYKNTPGEPETLQTGQNPISVSENAILAQLPKELKDTAVIAPGFSFADGQGRSEVLVEDTGQEEPSVEECTPSEDIVIAVDVEFVDPTCEADPSYSVTGDVDNVDVVADPETPVADGSTFTVTATAQEGFMFAGGGDTYSESAEFTAPDCTEVEPPVVIVDPPAETPEVTPTVVSAGVLPASGDLRSEQGLVLLGAGLVLLVAAGGVARPRRVRG